MSIESTIVEMATAARSASVALARCSSNLKNDALLRMARNIEAEAPSIKTENLKDLERAEKMGLSAAMIDRLKVTDAVIQSMAEGLREVAQLSNPVGSLSKTWLRPNGLEVARMRIPLGVIGIIF
jgi:glutamate-5-semialdehyde dehydrogenase